MFKEGQRVEHKSGKVGTVSHYNVIKKKYFVMWDGIGGKRAPTYCKPVNLKPVVALTTAGKNGDISKIRRLIEEEGVDPDYKDKVWKDFERVFLLLLAMILCGFGFRSQCV